LICTHLEEEEAYMARIIVGVPPEKAASINHAESRTKYYCIGSREEEKKGMCSLEIDQDWSITKG
jgi:hypothetical protein